MKRLALIILTVLCLFSCTENKQTENKQVEHLLAKVDRLQIENDSLAQILAEIATEEKPATNYWYTSEYDGRKFIKSGITNPTEFIENNLRERPELIPLKPVLGGAMHFLNIQLLGSEWVIADYEDGHIQGRAIYKYTLNNKGELEFELLNSMEP